MIEYNLVGVVYQPTNPSLLNSFEEISLLRLTQKPAKNKAFCETNNNNPKSLLKKPLNKNKIMQKWDTTAPKSPF